MTENTHTDDWLGQLMGTPSIQPPTSLLGSEESESGVPASEAEPLNDLPASPVGLQRSSSSNIDDSHAIPAARRGRERIVLGAWIGLSIVVAYTSGFLTALMKNPTNEISTVHEAKLDRAIAVAEEALERSRNAPSLPVLRNNPLLSSGAFSNGGVPVRGRDYSALGMNTPKVDFDAMLKQTTSKP